MNEFNEFELKIDFVRHSEEPSRVFWSMGELIDATASFDMALASSLGLSAEVGLLLEDITTGSLRTRLSSLLRMIDKEALREGAWNKVIGRLLDDGRGHLLSWLESEPKIDSPKQLEVIQKDIQRLAASAELAHIPAPHPVPVASILTSIRAISRSTSYLHEHDQVFYSTEQRIVEITKSIQISDELEEQLLTREKSTTVVEALLKVKKPDYIGHSKWELYYSQHPIKAPIMDTEWLASFQAAKQDLNPGDSLKARLEIVTSYGHDGQTIGHSFRVLRVFGILPGNSYEQLDLPTNN
jgi:hypothetical protein